MMDKELCDEAQKEIDEILAKAQNTDLNIDDYYDLYCNYTILENEDEIQKYKDLVKQIGIAECDNSATICNYLCIVFSDDKLYDEALRYINKAIDLEPNNADRYLSRSHIYGDMGRFEDAKSDCEIALQLDPAKKEEVKYTMDYLEFEKDDINSEMQPKTSLKSRIVKQFWSGIIIFGLFSFFLYSNNFELAFVCLVIGLIIMSINKHS